jgi:hypothetical protein
MGGKGVYFLLLYARILAHNMLLELMCAAVHTLLILVGRRQTHPAVTVPTNGRGRILLLMMGQQLIRGETHHWLKADFGTQPEVVPKDIAKHFGAI